MDMIFKQKVETALAAMGEKVLSYEEEAAEPTAEAYAYIESYAYEKKLYNTLLALPLVRGFMLAPADKKVTFRKDFGKEKAYYKHCLAVARMLIDLEIPISDEETDIILAAAICHIMRELIAFPGRAEELTTIYHLDPRVFETVKLVTRDDPLPEKEQRLFYQRIQGNKLALLVRLADRGNLVEQLYGMSLWDAQEYIRETRTYFFPMCIYGKEHFADIRTIINLLMEKMRTLIEVADILSTRYQEREVEITKDILDLQEENSRLRGFIATLEEEKKSIEG